MIDPQAVDLISQIQDSLLRGRFPEALLLLKRLWCWTSEQQRIKDQEVAARVKAERLLPRGWKLMQVDVEVIGAFFRADPGYPGGDWWVVTSPSGEKSRERTAAAAVTKALEVYETTRKMGGGG